MEKLSYGKAGVAYDVLDDFKRTCQRVARTTGVQLESHGFREVEQVRGESAYLVETDSEYYAHVEEGLGTKNLVADAVLEATGESFYRNIGIDTVAAIVNDLLTCGALPIVVAMHAAVGDVSWFAHQQRSQVWICGLGTGFCHRAGKGDQEPEKSQQARDAQI